MNRERAEPYSGTVLQKRRTKSHIMGSGDGGNNQTNTLSRGQDSNMRLPAYEADELPLLYPAMPMNFNANILHFLDPAKIAGVGGVGPPQTQDQNLPRYRYAIPQCLIKIKNSRFKILADYHI